jgi:hypothetical protein
VNSTKHSLGGNLVPVSCSVGELLLDYTTGKLYTQDITNTLVTLGRSLRRLVEFDNYIHGEVGISFLRLYLDEITGTYQIINQISRLVLADIGG